MVLSPCLKHLKEEQWWYIYTPHIVFIVSNYPIYHLGSILIDTNWYLSIHELKHIKEECRFNSKEKRRREKKIILCFYQVELYDSFDYCMSQVDCTSSRGYLISFTSWESSLDAIIVVWISRSLDIKFLKESFFLKQKKEDYIHHDLCNIVSTFGYMSFGGCRIER